MSSLPWLARVGVCLAILASIGAGDRFTHWDRLFGLLYLAPISLGTVSVGRRFGLALATAAAGLSYYGNQSDGSVSASLGELLVFLVVALLASSLKSARIENLRLATAIEQADDGIVITALDGTISYVNPAFTRITGYTRNEAVGRKTSSLKSGVHDPAFYRELWTTILAGNVWRGDITNRRKDGSLYVERMTIAPVRSEGSKITHFIAIKRDVTASTAVEAAHARMAAILEATTDLVGTCSPDGFVLHINAAGRKMVGLSETADLSRRRVSDFHPAWAQKLMRDEWIPTAVSKGVWQGESVVLRADGKEIPVSQVILAHKDSNGRVDFLSTIMRDLADLERIEHALRVSQEQFRQAQKMEAVGRLAGGVAHDFNNLLGVILGYSQLLWRQSDTTEAHRPKLAQIMKAAESATSLTRQLLAFSRKQVLEPKILSLNTLIADLGKMVERLIGEDIEMVVRAGTDLGPLYADAGQLEQVVLNLTVNARDAMPEGGTLTLETANAEVSRKDTALHGQVPPGRYVTLSVSDTGCGMSEATLAHLFEPFFTTKEEGKGTGLGLATVYGIVRQSGGHIVVDSRLGRGTTFRIYLPRVDPLVPLGSIVRSGGRAIGGSETVLLVEDDEAFRIITREVLRNCGYNVLVAAGPEEALKTSAEHPGRIDALITDVVMPGAGGRALSEQLTAARPEMQVLFMSGYTDDMLIHRGVLDGRARLLHKPFKEETLARQLRAALDGEAPAEDESA